MAALKKTRFSAPEDGHSSFDSRSEYTKACFGNVTGFFIFLHTVLHTLNLPYILKVHKQRAARRPPLYIVINQFSLIILFAQKYLK